MKQGIEYELIMPRNFALRRQWKQQSRKNHVIADIFKQPVDDIHDVWAAAEQALSRVSQRFSPQ